MQRAVRCWVENLLDSAGLVPTDSAGDPIIPYEIYAAVCLQLGYLYRERDESADYVDGYLPPAVVSLLYSYRDPVLR